MKVVDCIDSTGGKVWFGVQGIEKGWRTEAGIAFTLIGGRWPTARKTTLKN